MWKPVHELPPINPKYAGTQDVYQMPGSVAQAFGFEVNQASVAAPWGDKVRSVNTGVMDSTADTLRGLSMNISGLRNDIQELTKAIRAAMPDRDEVIIFRDISKADATEEISKLLQASRQALYPSDISTQLRIDYDLVMEVFNDLSAAGKIE
jgi:hypothetical protein